MIAGGIVTSDPENVKKYFDSICVGIAERSWGQILNDIENLESLQKKYAIFSHLKQ